jgi:hypothetical protein
MHEVSRVGKVMEDGGIDSGLDTSADGSRARVGFPPVDQEAGGLTLRMGRAPGIGPESSGALERLLAQLSMEGGPTRRQFLLAAGVGVLGAACTRRSSSAPAGPPGSIAQLTRGAAQLSVLGTGADAPPITPGRNRLGFILVTLQNQAIVGGSPQVWLALDERSRALGPFTSTWHPFTAFDKTGDRSPRSPLPGAFAAELDIPQMGNWLVAVIVSEGSKRLAGNGILPVTNAPVVAGIGQKATRTPTPVATRPAKIEEICTRTPVDPMHYISLENALENGKPTVVCFGTPLLCTSRLCGPVVDEQLLAFEHIGRDRANFIHVEEFLPGKDRTPPPATPENLSPPFKAWGLQTEPWTFVIARDGIIRFRSLGPATAPEIEQALQPLL